MGVFEHFPYTNFHELNLDWVLRQIHTLETRMDAAEARLDAAEARLDTVESEIEAIQAEIVLIRDRLTALEGRATALEDRCTALEQRCTELENRLAALEASQPLYIPYDPDNPPDPDDYQEIIEAESRPVYLRAEESDHHYIDLPLIEYYYNAGGSRGLVFFDASAEIASDISGYTYASPGLVGLLKSDLLPAHFEAKSASLPAIDSNNGKFLMVNAGGSGVEWSDVDVLPSKTGNAGKVLAVNAQETAVVWATVSGGGLPATSAADAGKVLTVTADGSDVEWATIPAGGIPSFGLGDAGKILAVNSDEDGVEWVRHAINETRTVTFLYTNYSAADLTAIDLLIASGTWTDAQLDAYDFNLDGAITAADRAILANMLDNSQNYTVDVGIQVDPDVPKRPICLYDENDDPTAWLSPGEVGAHTGKFDRVLTGSGYIDPAGNMELNATTDEKMTASPVQGIRFFDDQGTQLGVYPPDAKQFLQANDIGVQNLEGCAYWAYSSAGSASYSLSNDHTYLLTFVRRNSLDNSSTGAWIISSYSGASNITTLKSTSSAAVSVSGLTLTVSRDIAYSRITLTRLA